MTKRLTTAALSAALCGLLLAGCGTTDTKSKADPDALSSSTSGDCGDVKVATGPVSLTDSYGRKVELEKPAERVVVLEWQQIEDVLTLCLTPVGVADAKGYSLWDTAEPLPDGVTDVGTRGEPNFDTLLAAEPDLVIAEAYTAEDEIIKQLEKYDVPVLATKGADTKDPIQTMLDTFNLIAEATGREDRAATVVEEFQTSLADAKAAVAEAAPETTDFVYFDGWIQGGNVTLRPFGQGSLIGELGEELGLTNVWTGKVDPAYGLGQTDIEGMTKVGEANLFYTGTDDPESAYVPELEKNKIWASLPAVEDGRSHAFPPGIWTFGGPRSSEQILDAYVDLATS